MALNPEVLKQMIGLYNFYDRDNDSPKEEELITPAPAEPIINYGYSFGKVTKLLTTAIKTVSDAANQAIGNKEVEEKITQLCTEVNRRIDNTHTPQDWIKLIYFLDEKAAYAQSLKRRAGQSRCCEIFYAMISYIVHQLKQNSLYHEFLIKEINQLKDERKKELLDRHTGVKHRKGSDAKEANNQQKMRLKKLALLGDEDSLEEAITWNLFPYLHSVEEKEEELRQYQRTSSCYKTHNEFYPYCLQPDFYEIKYIDSYQRLACQSFESFENAAKNKISLAKVIDNGLTNLEAILDLTLMTAHPLNDAQTTSIKPLQSETSIEPLNNLNNTAALDENTQADFKSEPMAAVLKQILNLYTKYDKEPPKEEDVVIQPSIELANDPYGLGQVTKILTTAVKTVTDVVNHATGNKNVEEQITRLCEHVNRKIDGCRTPQDWIKLVYDLDEKASIAQSLKRRAGQSRCCEIFYAMISYIIHNLKQNHNDILLKEIEKLKKARQEALSERHNSVKTKNGSGAKDFNLSQKVLLKKLALLGDEDSLEEALSWNLFPYLHCVEDKNTELKAQYGRSTFCHDYNEFYPYCLQPKFFEIKYEDSFRWRTYEKFETYVEKAKTIVNKSASIELPIVAHPEQPPQQELGINGNNVDILEASDAGLNVSEPITAEGNLVLSELSSEPKSSVDSSNEGTNNKNELKVSTSEDSNENLDMASKVKGANSKISKTNGTLFKIPKPANNGGVLSPSPGQPPQPLKAHK